MHTNDYRIGMSFEEFKQLALESHRGGGAPAIVKIDRHKLIEDGNILGLLEHLRSSRLEITPLHDFADLRRCIAVKAQTDLSQLGDDIFAIILEFGLTTLTRCLLFVNAEVEACDDACSGRLVPMPQGLVKDGWLERIERLSRFLTEMIALRARVQHLEQINEPTPSDKRRSGRSRPAGGVATDRSKDVCGEEDLAEDRRSVSADPS